MDENGPRPVVMLNSQQRRWFVEGLLKRLYNTWIDAKQLPCISIVRPDCGHMDCHQFTATILN